MHHLGGLVEPGDPVRLRVDLLGRRDNNYDLTYVDGTVTVTPAPLTITASSGTMTYGSTPPTITPIYGGLVNSDTAPATPPRLHHDRQLVEHDRLLPEHLLGRGRPQLHISYINGSVTVIGRP